MAEPIDPIPGGEIALYESPDGDVRLDVSLREESVWLSLDQMMELFGRDKSVISRHLRNVFGSGELAREAVVAKSATTAADGKTYQVDYYNLDAIISVGYRVNSRRGTQFRIWATGTLREHLLRGYTLNERRLREKGLAEMEQALDLLSRTLDRNALVRPEGQALLAVIGRYARTWRLLLDYDEDRLASSPANPVSPAAILSLEEARSAVRKLRTSLVERGEAGDLFGQERGHQFEAILAAIEQTFGGEALYPSAQTRAAHLLYFVIKDHPFSDGNKRIGSLLFLEYVSRSGLLDSPDGRTHFDDNAIVALALLVAESDPAHKELMIRLVQALLDEGSGQKVGSSGQRRTSVTGVAAHRRSTPMADE